MNRTYSMLALAIVLVPLAGLRLSAAENRHAPQHEKANELIAEQKYQRAVKLLKATSRKADESCAECYLGLAKAHHLTGEFRKAEKQARRAFELAPDLMTRAFALNRLGLILFAGGDGNPKDFEEASEAFEAVIEISKGRASTPYYSLGEVLLKMERDTEGIAALERFVEAKPESPRSERARLLIADPRRARMDLLPDFALTTLQDEEITSDDLLGQVAVLDFWATWCPPCVASIPHLKNLNKRFDSDGLQLLGISADQSEKTLKKFLEEHEMDWPQHWDGNGPSLQALFRISGYPTYVVVGHDGVVTFRRSGWSDQIALELDRAIKKALRAASEEVPGE